MTNSDNQSSPFGPSAEFDPTAHEPSTGKSALMSQMMAKCLRRSPPNPPLTGELLLNSTTSIPFKSELHDGDVRHTLLWGSTREGMSEAGKPVKAALMADGNWPSY